MHGAPVMNGWIKEAGDRARLEEARECLVRILRKRFPAALTEDSVKTIDAQPSLDRLHGWFDVALSAPSADEFLAALRS